MSVVIGLDVGTQSVKLVALDVGLRRIVAEHGRPFQLIASDDGSRKMPDPIMLPMTSATAIQKPMAGGGAGVGCTAQSYCS